MLNAFNVIICGIFEISTIMARPISIWRLTKANGLQLNVLETNVNKTEGSDLKAHLASCVKDFKCKYSKLTDLIQIRSCHSDFTSSCVHT